APLRINIVQTPICILLSGALMVISPRLGIPVLALCLSRQLGVTRFGALALGCGIAVLSEVFLVHVAGLHLPLWPRGLFWGGQG
ncbi:MAG: hypothetical protein U1D06_12705, partial [Paracoccaceae bacterium]|nr:hypothetical protein [Paracoccaceae bacterium]